jgi:hypothetical protein
MAKPQPPCVEIYKWLQCNLGKRCLAPLTGSDHKALDAAVQTVQLWTYCDDRASVAKAFGIIVSQMQPGTRWLAYHSIAKVSDWGFRDELWDAAGLDFEDIRDARECSFGPGGPREDLSKK